MPLQARLGRVTIWFAGLTWMAFFLGLVGIFACLKQTSAIKWYVMMWTTYTITNLYPTPGPNLSALYCGSSVMVGLWVRFHS
jgi:hypothetical protein